MAKMLKTFRPVSHVIAAIIAIAAIPAGVSAKPTIVVSLATAPLIGPIPSTPRMQEAVREHYSLIGRAAVELGVSTSQYEQFRLAIASGQVRWVELPRHLEAMSWSSGSRIHTIRDVMIPRRTHGWEVDVPDGGRVLALYMPAACGNLSIAHRPLRRVAARPSSAGVVAAEPASPAEEPAPQVVEAATVPPPVIDLPPPVKAKSPSPFAFLIPLLFGGAVGVGLSSGGSAGSSIPGSPALCP